MSAPDSGPLDRTAELHGRFAAFLDGLADLASDLAAYVIDARNQLDADPDLEPSTSAMNGMVDGCSMPVASGALDDCEPDPSGYGDEAGMSVEETGEPSLGWLNPTNQGTRHWRGDSGLPWSVTDGEAGDDTGIGDARGLDFDAEPDDNGIADDGGADEVMGEHAVRRGFDLDRQRRRPGNGFGLVYVGEMEPEGFRPFRAPTVTEPGSS